ncbi:hypothetical protein F4859DRAFT_516928 [Xylaria cf. heliscus]|nr:hypothetical protein F4859DRAFT_516928 [Xylaria cf. heliscus]
MVVNLTDLQISVLAAAAADQLRGIFSDHPLWELERILGHGAYGITALLRDRGAMKFGQFKTRIRKPKRVVLKRPIYQATGERDFQAELEGLKRTRGLAHHVQAFGTTMDVSTYRSKSKEGVRDALRNIFAPFNNPPINIFTILGHYQGPALLLEYIENGNLLDFVSRAFLKRIIIPNRLLWRFYFCLIRGVSGMVFRQPPYKEGGPLILETAPVNAQPRDFMHGDIAHRNIMIGECDPTVEDHRITPILKFIDFGLSHQARNHESAVRANITDATFIIEYMIAHTVIHQVPRAIQYWDYKGVQTSATALIPEIYGYDPFPNLDEELRDLIAESMRANQALRPSVQEIYMRVENGMKKTASQYPFREFEESDIAIEARLQQILHDV